MMPAQQHCPLCTSATPSLLLEVFSSWSDKDIPTLILQLGEDVKDWHGQEHARREPCHQTIAGHCEPDAVS